MPAREVTRRAWTAASRRCGEIGFTVLVVAIGLVAGWVVAYGSVGDPGEPAVRKVLLLGIDGVRSDALKLSHTPTLDELARRGAFAHDTQILGERYRRNDTVSAAGWSSILTGVWADRHGVNGSTFEGGNFRKYPSFLERVKRARPEAKTGVFVSWPDIARHIIGSADVLQVFAPTVPSAEGYLEADREVAEAAGRHLAEGDPDVLFVYWALPDATGHEKGFHPNVGEYRRAIQTVDRFAGVVLRGLWRRKTLPGEDWLVIVTSDHGGQGTHHRNGQNDPDVLTVFMIVSGPAARRGRIGQPTYIVDAPVTALTHLGVSIDDGWGLDGRAVGLKPR